jgi:hypothetical protein
MNSRTVTILVSASKETVFDFLSNIENLPAWATEFCEGLKKEGGHYKVITSAGELFFKIESDRKSGVVDMFAGPSLDRMGIFPCRVIAMPGGATAISFTFFQPPDMPDEVYERQHKSLLIEMDGLKRRFGAELMTE